MHILYLTVLVSSPQTVKTQSCRRSEFDRVGDGLITIACTFVHGSEKEEMLPMLLFDIILALEENVSAV